MSPFGTSIEKLTITKDEERAKNLLENMKRANHFPLLKILLKEYQKAGGELTNTEINLLREGVFKKRIRQLEWTIKKYEGMELRLKTKDFARRFKKMKEELAKLKEEYKKFKEKK